MKKILLSSFVLASFLFAAASPQVEITGEDVKEQNEVNIPVKAEKKESMRSWLRKVEKKYKKPDNKIFTASVAVKGLDTDAQFGDYINNAFDRAFLEVRAKQILDKARDVGVKEVADIFSTNLDDAETEKILKANAAKGLNAQKDAEKIELEIAREKMRKKLGEEKLSFANLGSLLDSVMNGASDEEIDAALAKQGITNTKTLSREEKINTFKDNYSKTIARKGSGDIEGLVPIQTKLIKNEKGTYELGLVAIVSPKTLQIARDLHNKRPSRIKKTGECKSLEEQIPIEDLPTIYEMVGPRLYYNEACEPVIISYGRANFISTHDDIQNKASEKIAEKQADLRADAYITNFIASKITTTTVDRTDEVDMKNAVLNASVEVNLDSNKEITEADLNGEGAENESIRKSINYFTSKITATSNEKLNGVESFGAWDTLDEPEEEYPRVVGVIKYYSSTGILNSKQFYQNLNKGVKQAPKSSGSKGGAKSIESYNNNSVDDF